MRLRQSGFSTVECLMALVVFTLGMLGAVGTVAVSIRLEAQGAVAAEASRWSAGLLDSLRTAVAQSGGRCSAVVSATRSGAHGLSAQWQVRGVAHGAEIQLQLSAPLRGRSHRDTLNGFVPCR